MSGIFIQIRSTANKLNYGGGRNSDQLPTHHSLVMFVSPQVQFRGTRKAAIFCVFDQFVPHGVEPNAASPAP